MKKRNVRWLAGVTAAMTIMTAFANTAVAAEVKGEDITFSFFNPNSNRAHKPADDAPVLEQLFEKTGVKLEWEVPLTGVTERFNIMLATGDLPDIILFSDQVSDKTILQQFVESGYLVDLAELFQEYAPNAYKNLESYLSRFMDENGSIWYLPGNYEFEDTESMPEARIAVGVRSAYFDENGWDKVPTTMEEYKALLEDIKESTDMIPVALALGNNGHLSDIIDIGAAANGLSISDKMVLEDGELKYFTQAEGMKEYFKFLNELNQEGLLDPESAVMSAEMLAEKCTSGKVWSFIGRWRQVYNSVRSYEQSNGTENLSVTLFPKMSEEVEQVTYAPYTKNLLSGGLAITTACEDPERFLQFYDYLSTEEGHMAAIGITNYDWDGTAEGEEGYDWKVTDEVYTEDRLYVTNTDWLTEQWGEDENWWWNRGVDMMWDFTYGEYNYPDGQYDFLGDMDQSKWWSEAETRINSELGITGTNYYDKQREISVDVTEISGLTLDASSQEYLDLSDMNMTVEKYIPRVIMAETDAEFEAEWEAMETELNKNGIDGVVAAYQTLYQERMEIWNQ